MRCIGLCLLSAYVLAGCGGGRESAEPPSTTETTAAGDTTQPVPPPPSTLPMSWSAAGAFVWHETDVSPEALGARMRHAGFGWVAVFLHDGISEDPVEDRWIDRFRQASGLAVGGWGSLRSRPVEEATLVSSLVTRYGLDFYIANAEADHAYSGPYGLSAERFARSRRFVEAFRRWLPTLPAGLSSYCRADIHDLDWKSWRVGGFVFLPQAYVNDFGRDALPRVCVDAGRGRFAANSMHPTIGMYPGVKSSLGVVRYAQLLGQAGVIGFSVYLAETRMTDAAWRQLGAELRARGIAVPPS